MFDVSVEQLRELWREVVAVQPRVELLAEDEEGQQFDWFISVSSSQSTLAIYSRSIYGESDFGVNRERIDAWLKTFREGLCCNSRALRVGYAQEVQNG